MSRDKKIYEKINAAVRLLCDVYDLLNEEEEIKINSEYKNEWYGVSEFSKKHVFFTYGKLRNYIQENTDGFNEKVILKKGKRILINEKRFFEWLENSD